MISIFICIDVNLIVKCYCSIALVKYNAGLTSSTENVHVHLFQQTHEERVDLR